jgi:hypothetical protein
MRVVDGCLHVQVGQVLARAVLQRGALAQMGQHMGLQRGAGTAEGASAGAVVVVRRRLVAGWPLSRLPSNSPVRSSSYSKISKPASSPAITGFRRRSRAVTARTSPIRKRKVSMKCTAVSRTRNSGICWK